jgi:PhnB protein
VSVAVASIQPELWVDDAPAAVTFDEAAFGARVLHRVGAGVGAEIVVQLAVGDACFWVEPASPPERLDPKALGGATNRTLLVVDDPGAVAGAVAAGATERSPIADEHGWRIGRVVDPFGHEWELGKPLGRRPS